MNDKNKELEVASVERIKYFVNLFYYYMKAKKLEIEVKSKNDILELFKKTNDIASESNFERHEEVKQLLNSIENIDKKTYTQIAEELKLFSAEESPMDFLRKSVFKEMQNRHPEFAAEYTRSIL